MEEKKLAQEKTIQDLHDTVVQLSRLWESSKAEELSKLKSEIDSQASTLHRVQGDVARMATSGTLPLDHVWSSLRAMHTDVAKHSGAIPQIESSLHRLDSRLKGLESKAPASAPHGDELRRAVEEHEVLISELRASARVCRDAEARKAVQQIQDCMADHQSTISRLQKAISDCGERQVEGRKSGDREIEDLRRVLNSHESALKEFRSFDGDWTPRRHRQGVEDLQRRANELGDAVADIRRSLQAAGGMGCSQRWQDLEESLAKQQDRISKLHSLGIDASLRQQQDVERLSVLVKQHQSAIAELKSQDGTNRAQQHVHALDQTQSRLQRLEADLSEIKSTAVEAAEEERHKFGEMDMTLLGHKTAISKLQSAVKKLTPMDHQRVQELASDLDDQKERMLKMEAAILDLQLNQRPAQEFHDLKAEMAEKEVEVKALRADLTDQRALTTLLETSIRELASNQRHQEVADLRMSMNQKCGEIEALRSDLMHQKNLIAQLGASLREAALNKPSMVEVEELKGAVGEKALEVDVLKNGIESQQKSIKQLESALSLLNATVNSVLEQQEKTDIRMKDCQKTQNGQLKSIEEQVEGVLVGLDAFDRKINHLQAEKKVSQARGGALEQGVVDLRAEVTIIQEAQATLPRLEERMRQFASSLDSHKLAIQGIEENSHEMAKNLRSALSQKEAGSNANEVGQDMIRQLQGAFLESIRALETKMEARDWDLIAFEEKISSMVDRQPSANCETASTIASQGNMIKEAHANIHQVRAELIEVEKRLQQSYDLGRAASMASQGYSQEHSERLLQMLNQMGQSHSEGIGDCRQRLDTVEQSIATLEDAAVEMKTSMGDFASGLMVVHESMDTCMEQMQELVESRSREQEAVGVRESELTARIWELRGQLKKTQRVLSVAQRDKMASGHVQAQNTAVGPRSEQTVQTGAETKQSGQKPSPMSSMDLSRWSSLDSLEVADARGAARAAVGRTQPELRVPSVSDKQRPPGGTVQRALAKYERLGSRSGRSSTVTGRNLSVGDLGSTLDEFVRAPRGNSGISPVASSDSSVLHEALKVAERLSSQCTPKSLKSHPALRSASTGGSAMDGGLNGAQMPRAQSQSLGHSSTVGKPEMAFINPMFHGTEAGQHGFAPKVKLKRMDEDMGPEQQQAPKDQSNLGPMSSNPVFAGSNEDRASASVESDFSW
eukprot:evm.model.scf_166.2 EVM.evm.TU.scf_166.2   scf_166:7970-12127(-)